MILIYLVKHSRRSRADNFGNIEIHAGWSALIGNPVSSQKYWPQPILSHLQQSPHFNLVNCSVSIVRIYHREIVAIH